MDNHENSRALRSLRKKEHIEQFLNTDSDRSNLFEHIYLEHNALPELDFEEISTETTFLNKAAGFPLMINAITGGFEGALDINRDLARLAVQFNIPIAVGSQAIALNSKEHEVSFRLVREIVKEGIVISNLNAASSLEDMLKAIDMIKADAIQLHLNAAQEMCMAEGDRNFRGILNNISEAVRKIPKPVIVKEVGFGISKSAALRLYDAGVRYIDTGGSGGTNFIKIESARNTERDHMELYDWGIPSALSLLEARSVSSEIKIISSGGLNRADEVVKALCAGADMAGISGALLRVLLLRGFEAAEDFLGNIIYKTKIMMLLLGKKNVGELRTVNFKLKGELKELYGGNYGMM